MKRTTIMVDEELLYDLQELAGRLDKSTSSLIREALATYVIEQRRRLPPQNPLLDLIALGAGREPLDLADGGDEALLNEGLDPLLGWRSADDGDH